MGIEIANDDFAVVARVIRSRRTNMIVDRTRPVEPALVKELCELAQWAPNHKRTWPWRFAFVEGDGRARLGEAISDAMEVYGDPPEKVVKARTKYLRTPATLVVGSAGAESPHRAAENRDATAAGIQNFLLAATAAGLTTYWGSCPNGAHEAVGQLCGFDAHTHISALIYLGWAGAAMEAPPRPTVQLHVIS